ncbi:jg26811 [Pararge aegeria aegeria]|uniref:Jg26811 protein n=1 Tax=Pararge aegeria aegeria TaxID=348720 RepID=A0A8S4SFB5_9NEOP|nr:jg26811 [Pararge aegeria aegeria]
MAAVLKKRALAEYNKSFQDGPASKKLHLVKKPLIGSSAAAFVGLLEKCKSSDEALQLLLRISDCLQFQESDVEEAIKKLSEHFQSEEESVVRVKILWLFSDIGLECPGANLNNLIDETIHLIKNETSHKVIAQGIATLVKLGNKLSEDKILMARLVNVARDNLKDTSHQVKCRCLQLMSELYPICPETDRTLEMTVESDAMVKLLGDYSNAEDARVRCEAFQSLLTLHERGLTISFDLYDQVCAALSDDYEIVREVALKLVWLMGSKYPENTVTLQDGETTMRLVDDAFIRICSAVNDLCMQVRALSCSLLGTTRAVSDRFLLQTLDKQLMSNMKVRWLSARCCDTKQSRSEKSEAAIDDSAVIRFFDTVLQHIDNVTLSTMVRLKMLQSAEEQLNKLSEMEPMVSGAANFTALFARCVLSLHTALNATNGPPTHALQQLTTDCLRLQYQFSGVSEQENACVWQLALRVCAARLLAAVQNATVANTGTGNTGNTASGIVALSAATALTHHAELLDRILASAGVEPDPFTIAVFQQLSQSGEHKPSALARAVQPLLLSAPLPVIPKPNLKIRMCSASIIEPATDNDTVLRFCAGLITGVALEAEVVRVKDPSALRVRVAYPDTRVHALVPPRDHLRPLDHTNTNDDGTQNVRLLTKVLISHGVWTEPCGVDISVCLAVEEGSSRDAAPLVELCRPVRVTVAPKPIKRGI